VVDEVGTQVAVDRVELTTGEERLDERVDDLLVVLFVSRSSCWGSLILIREIGHPDFTREDRALLTRLSPKIAEGLRRALLLSAARRSEDEAGAGLVVLDGDGGLESLTPAAAMWLEQLGDLGSASGTSPGPTSAARPGAGWRSTPPRCSAAPRRRSRS
jgi:hypothetical protein